MTTKNSRVLEIDALRGLAAIMVCLFHFYILFPNAAFSISIFKYGGTGVDLFFIISGFVIFMSISSSENLKDFWFARFNRLFPTYWLSILIALVSYYLLTDFSFHKTWNNIFGNLLMIQPVFKAENLVDAYWTLYIEICFYIFISIVWAMKLINKIERIIWIGLIFSICINSCYILFKDVVSYERIYIISRSVLPLICYFNFFAAGIVFYNIRQNGWTTNRSVLLVICLFLTALIHNISGRFNLFFGTTERMCCVVIFFILFLFVVNKKAEIFKQPWLLVFGNISYALYLIHESIGINIAFYLAKHINKSVAELIGISFSIILALAITYFFEKPVHKWLRIIYNKMKPNKYNRLTEGIPKV